MNNYELIKFKDKDGELEKESTCAKNAHMVSNRLYYTDY